MDMKILDLTADNAFDFCAVLDAVGMENVAGVFDKTEIAALRKGGKDMKGVGLVLAMKVFGVIVGHLSAAREPLYTFLAGCVQWDNGHPVTRDELRAMKLGAFVGLLKAFASKKDIADLFTDVLGSADTAPSAPASGSTGDTPTLTVSSAMPSGAAD